MKRRTLVGQSIVTAAFFACGCFTLLIVWSHYRGGYQFWDSVYLAGVASVGMGIYSYWRACRKPASEHGGPSEEENVLLKKHPLLVPAVQAGLFVACAVFTFLIVLAHFRGAYEFWEIFYLAAAAGVAGSIEGYRRALRKLAGEGEPT